MNKEIPLREDGSIDFDTQVNETFIDRNFNAYNEAIDLYEEAYDIKEKIAVLKELLKVAESRANENQQALPVHIKEISFQDIPKPPETYKNEG